VVGWRDGRGKGAGEVEVWVGWVERGGSRGCIQIRGLVLRGDGIV
jgi:hypothetical protein